jgi:hypothetical protein
LHPTTIICIQQQSAIEPICFSRMGPAKSAKRRAAATKGSKQLEEAAAKIPSKASTSKPAVAKRKKQRAKHKQQPKKAQTGNATEAKKVPSKHAIIKRKQRAKKNKLEDARIRRKAQRLARKSDGLSFKLSRGFNNVEKSFM